ncbi:hypothetical protein DSM106972_027170 [Dulcicalothrix desertica PCC 7102]|uniref:Uncharacterized protein n=1 Tax=Dulcicalothrix desertica PCC 7102 TaxID=232991 RepID=A0A3S1APR1_9CYAN|nr:hypothetical protein [Dulcicalothrix desertica]RUT06460.1 hypothetical protein DSM106972_027170 [Dulcicalothrix desertica PCC 7102]TWH62650.1 hypothetical protein CAL7102_00150 [Dulcicalothrix desertica PCC 7102]
MKNENLSLQSKKLKNWTFFSKFSVKLVFIGMVSILYLFAPISVSSASAGSGYYPVCWFRDRGNPPNQTWQWGLNDDDSYLELDGSWIKDGDKDVFLSNTSMSVVLKSCGNAQKYYNPSGDFFGSQVAYSNVFGGFYDIRWR